MSSIAETSNPFSVGASFSRTWDIFTGSFGKFFVLTAIPLLPILVLDFIPGMMSRPGALNPHFGGLMALGLLIRIVLDNVARATVLYGTFQELKGESFSIGESLNVGLNRLFPVVGVSILTALLVGLASMLLLVPGLIVMCMFFVAIPVCVIERPGVTASLSRSGALTKGYRWQIFGIVILLVIAGMILNFLATFLTAMTGSVSAIFVVSFLVQAIATTFGAIIAGVVYSDLRLAKDGVDTSKLANVFS